MWFEILPAYGIIVAAMTVPTVGVYFLNKLAFGNAYRRDLRFRWNRYMYQRDCRLTNNSPYKSKGLESLPDK